MKPISIHYRMFNTPVGYEEVWERMRVFTHERNEQTEDEIWFLEHTPVFSLGQAGKPEHILFTGHQIPLIRSDRGGQVTYHGPGQLVVYFLINLKRLQIYVKEFVSRVEDIALQTLRKFGVQQAIKIPTAPGIYVPWKPSEAEGVLAGYAKIAALGLKVHNGCTYHGLSLNVRMDLRPFGYINPCGYNNLATLDMASLGVLPAHQTTTDLHAPIMEAIQNNLFSDYRVTPVFHMEP